MSNRSTLREYHSTGPIVVPNASVLAVPTSVYTLIPAPGAGFRIVWQFADLHTNLVAPYTNIDAAAYSYLLLSTNAASSYIVNDTAPATGPAFTSVTKLLNTNVKSSVVVVPQSYATDPVDEWGNAAFVVDSDNDNQPLIWQISNGASGNLTGGDASNYVAWDVFYKIVRVV